MKILRPAFNGSMGECTAVASAKRAVRGVRTEREREESDDFRGRVVVMVTAGIPSLMDAILK